MGLTVSNSIESPLCVANGRGNIRLQDIENILLLENISTRGPKSWPITKGRKKQS